MNYGELKSLVEGYLHRTDLTIEDFVILAEQRIGRDVRILENRVTETKTPSSGEVDLPTRFAEMRRVSTGSGSSLVILKPISVHAEVQFSVSGDSEAYYITDKIYLVPSADTDVDLDYYEYPESLEGAGNSATRPILTRYADLYLYGVLAEACLFTQDYEAHQLWIAKYDEAVRQANAQAEQAYSIQATSYYGFNYPVARGR